MTSLKEAAPLPKVFESARIRIAVSSCLLGERVRFDGDHKRNIYITESLAAYFDFVPVCPELAIGMGVPREPIHIVRTKQGLRVIGTRHPDLDVTDPLRRFGEAMAEKLRDIDGYILKKDSPSCGMERVPVHGTGEDPSHAGVGIYAQAFMTRRPWLPVEEEGRLSDPVLRENFFKRVFVHHRWRRLCAEGITPATLVEFHTRHKFAVMPHSQAAYRRLGRLVACAGSKPVEALAAVYISDFWSFAMTSCGSVLPHLASLENSRFLAAFGEGVALALVCLPLLALLLRGLPTLGSVNKIILPPIHGETQVIGPRARRAISFRDLARGSSYIPVFLQRVH